MSRQGVRWRFWRLFNEVYVSAYETIYLMESQFGTQLRQQALAIAKERVEMRKRHQHFFRVGIKTDGKTAKEKPHQGHGNRDPERLHMLAEGLGKGLQKPAPGRKPGAFGSDFMHLSIRPGHEGFQVTAHLRLGGKRSDLR